jgi:CRP-like cAMP-binding protein
MTLNNTLLDRMDPDVLAALTPHLQPREVANDQVLIDQDAPVVELHFPTTAVLSNDMTFADGSAVETAVVGNDGVSGLAAFLADARCGWRVRVQQAGLVLAIPQARLRTVADGSADLRRLLLKAAYDYQAQAAQTAACNAIHQLTPRLARWILMADDRSGGRETRLTQEDMARALGVGRTTVNEAANRLRSTGAINYTRARMTVADRAVLEGQACECYRMQRSRTDSLGLSPKP